MDQLALDLPQLFTRLDGVALAVFVLGTVALGWSIEHPRRSHPSTHRLMKGYRHRWMEAMADRENRIFDAQLLASLRQGASFFASATLIAIGGGVALLGQVEQVQQVARDLSAMPADPAVVWELKIIFVLVLLVSAFLKFVWSIRVFGYCAVVMASTPNDSTDPRAKVVGARAAELNYLADRSFTRGLRGVYFALAALAWLVGAWAFLAATLFTIAVVVRREFASQSRAVLLDRMPKP